MQMSGWAGAQNLHAESGKAVAYSGMTDCFRRTIQEEGTRALFKVRCCYLLCKPMLILVQPRRQLQRPFDAGVS